MKHHSKVADIDRLAKDYMYSVIIDSDTIPLSSKLNLKKAVGLAVYFAKLDYSFGFLEEYNVEEFTYKIQSDLIDKCLELGVTKYGLE